MDKDQLTQDDKDTIKSMVDYCLKNCIGLGMDEGYTKQGRPTKQRERFEQWVKSLHF